MIDNLQTIGRIEISQADCRRLDRATDLEWIETNGLGSFASGTVSGAHSRRYHGLLDLALRPPVGRVLTLAKLEDNICLAGREMPLGCNVYKSTTVHPEGYRLMTGFALSPWPVWSYEVLGLRLRREVIMLHERQGVLVRYTPVFAPGEEPETVLLRFRPLFAWRNHHAIERENPRREIELEHAGEGERRFVAKARTPLAPITARNSRPGEPDLIVPPDLALQVQSTHDLLLMPEPCWYFDFSYGVEAHRGDPTREDLHSPGEVFVEIPAGETFSLWVGLDALPESVTTKPETLQALVDAELERRLALIVPKHENNPTACRLARAADQFIVRRGPGLSSVIAGYPWFTDWGRDTMIGLPGLCLATGRFAQARAILLAFAGLMDKGIIPNRFPDETELPEYNTVDATLWMFEATSRYVAATGDKAILKDHLYKVFSESVAWHERGTHYDIQMDPADGLLRATSRGIQLTWMDAKMEETVFTPRYGKPVEINALWVNALRLLQGWAGEMGDAATVARCERIATLATESFNRRFVVPGLAGLADVVDSEGPGTYDGKLRPNQIFAVALRHTPLDPKHFGTVVDAVASTLVTPRGLRSLSPHDPQYKPNYSGDRFTRDASYHQGTVWSWLIGPYVDAYFRAYGRNAETARHAAHLLHPLVLHLEEGGLGQIAEIFEGNPPHHERGCFAQAWSVAELLRIMVDYDLFPEA